MGKLVRQIEKETRNAERREKTRRKIYLDPADEAEARAEREAEREMDAEYERSRGFF